MSELRRPRVTTVTTVTNDRSAGDSATSRGRERRARATNHDAARAAGRARGGLCALYLLTSLAVAGAGCGSHGTPEEVAAACKHQLTVAKRGAIAAHLRSAGQDPDSEGGRVELEASLRAALADEATQASLARCRALYAELSSERIACILAADDPVAINACTPQADRKR